jgi:hypothetical protein
MSSMLNPDLKNYDKHFGTYKDFDLWQKGIGLKRKIEIQLETLDNYFKEVTVDYLKIDTQGTELNILKGAHYLLQNKKVSVIKVEVSAIPVYKNQALFSDIDLHLRNLNYTLVDFITYHQDRLPVFQSKKHWQHSGSGGDAIYILNVAPENKKQVLIQGLIIAWLGYDSLAKHLLSSIQLSAQEIQFILSLSDLTWKHRLKNLIKNLLPPAFILTLKQLQKLFKLQRR